MRKIVYIFALIILCSCSRGVIEHTEYLHDTLVEYRMRIDSIYQLDSVYIKEYTIGDTVHQDKESFRVRYDGYRIHDSIYVNKTDTVTKNVPVVKKVTVTETVEKQLTFWQKARILMGDVMIGGILGILTMLAVRIVIMNTKKRV